MSGKRTSRIQLMFDDEELSALDEWRFNMRMPSRAAAMRALMRFGLKLDVEASDLNTDPATVASNKIGVVGGLDLDPAAGRRDDNDRVISDRTLELVRELAEKLGVTPDEAVRMACVEALSTGSGGVEQRG